MGSPENSTAGDMGSNVDRENSKTDGMDTGLLGGNTSLALMLNKTHSTFNDGLLMFKIFVPSLSDGLRIFKILVRS